LGGVLSDDGSADVVLEATAARWATPPDWRITHFEISRNASTLAESLNDDLRRWKGSLSASLAVSGAFLAFAAVQRFARRARASALASDPSVPS
jgi:hypothetical protein